jgi:mannosyltransferase
MQVHPKWRDFIPTVNGAAVRLRTDWVAAVNSPRIAAALPIALAVLALSLRLHGLADKPFWYDEILTLNRAKLPLGELIVSALRHKHYPSYFLLAAPFATAHHAEWMLRLPSALFGAICVFLVTRLTTEIRTPAAGLVAGLLMALSPIEVQFAQEARPYTLISCLVLVAMWGLARIAQQSGAAAAPMTPPEQLRGAWVAYVAGTLGALFVENNTVPWLLASNFALMAIVYRARSGQGTLLREWAWSQAVILLVWLPGLAIMLSINRGTVLDGLEWIPKASWDSVRSIVGAVYLFRIADMMTFTLLPAPLPVFGAVIVMIAALGAWRLRANPALLAVVGLAVLAMPATVLLTSAFQPLLVPRYLLWGTGAFFVLAGIGATALPARISVIVALFVAIGGAISLAPYYSSETKPRWDQAAAYLAGNVRPHDVIVAQNPGVRFVLNSYGRSSFNSEFPVLSWNARDTEDLAAEGERAWAVYGRVGQGTLESEDEFRRKWSAFGTPAEQIRFGSFILVLRFDSPSAARQRRLDSVQLEPKNDTGPHSPIGQIDR